MTYNPAGMVPMAGASPLMPQMYQGQNFAYNMVNFNKFHAAQMLVNKKNIDEDANRFLNINVEDLAGQILNLCKDQHGCRFLQKKLDEEGEATILMVFKEVFVHFTDLMIGISVLLEIHSATTCARSLWKNAPTPSENRL
jgi:Pumilio-family RNA binding repeat